MSEGPDLDVKRCAKCAAWIPATATMCAYCNTSSPDEPLRRAAGPAFSFRHGISVTPILIAANVTYFLFSLVVQHRVTPDGNLARAAVTGNGLGLGLYASGAYSHAEVVEGHEWWRILAAAFLHIGVIHLAINMWSLYRLGTLAERLFGSAKFLAVYVATGVCASLTGSLWYAGVMHLPEKSIPGMAGASGALFGIAGLLVAFLMRAGTARAREVAWSIGQSVLLMLGFGYFTNFISQTGHVGGLLPGLAFGLLVRADFGGRANPVAARRWTAAAWLGVGACVASLLRAAWHAFQLIGGH